MAAVIVSKHLFHYSLSMEQLQDQSMDDIIIVVRLCILKRIVTFKKKKK